MAKATQKKQKLDSNTKITTSSINSSSCSDDYIVKVSGSKGKRTRKGMPRDSPSQRSSIYRGVTRHRWTGRYEAHLWDKDCWSGTQKKKGRQVYLGAYDDEAAAARAYDLAALKYWGKETTLNFPLSNYENDLNEMESLTKEEYIGSLRRKSSGFSRGVSKFRGVARHHHNGRWEARIGRVLGNKYLYLGTYATQEEAATAYDMAAIEHRGLNAVTNFDLSRYIHLLKPNSCDDQICPSIIAPTKSLETSTDDTSVSSTSCSNVASTNEDNSFMLSHDQIEEHDICFDEAMLWGELPSSVDYSSPSTGLLEFDEFDLLQCDHPTGNGLCPFSGGQTSSSDDIGSNGDGFFSELNSFLCDFDVVEEETTIIDV